MNRDIAKIIMILGIFTTVMGGLWYFLGDKFPLGKLPGDIIIKKPGFSFYFPITTCLLVSVVFSIIAKLIKN